MTLVGDNCDIFASLFFTCHPMIYILVNCNFMFITSLSDMFANEGNFFEFDRILTMYFNKTNQNCCNKYLLFISWLKD